MRNADRPLGRLCRRRHIRGPLLLAVSAGTGSTLTPHATEQAILPAFLVLSICALAIGLAPALPSA
jgi:hypothetical protein